MDPIGIFIGMDDDDDCDLDLTYISPLQRYSKQIEQNTTISNKLQAKLMDISRDENGVCMLDILYIGGSIYNIPRKFTRKLINKGKLAISNINDCKIIKPSVSKAQNKITRVDNIISNYKNKFDLDVYEYGNYCIEYISLIYDESTSFSIIYTALTDSFILSIEHKDNYRNTKEISLKQVDSLLSKAANKFELYEMLVSKNKH